MGPGRRAPPVVLAECAGVRCSRPSLWPDSAEEVDQPVLAARRCVVSWRWKERGSTPCCVLYAPAVHVICTAVEYHILTVEPWYDDPASVWIPHPYLQTGHHSMELQLLYVGALAVWVYTCFMHRFVDERKRDYFEMFVHHVATIALVGMTREGRGGGVGGCDCLAS